MSNALLSYLNKRMDENKLVENSIGPPGPIITISREVGCNGVKLAKKIAKSMNKRNLDSEWKVLSKEVFFQSAKELDVQPEKVLRILRQSDRYVFNDILDAFSNKKYKSEKQIIKTVTNVIRTFAIQGFYVIVGRAGHIIAHDINNAIHVRLIAPLEYRIKTIMENNHLDREEAIYFIEKVEKERLAFRKSIGIVEYEEDVFDIFLNRASFDEKKTIELIESAIDKKNILKDYSNKINYY